MLFPWPAHHVSSHSATNMWAWWMVSDGALLRCSATSKIKWIDVIFSQKGNANEIPKSMTITIRALVDDTIKPNECSEEFKFVAVEVTAICLVSAFWGWRRMSIRLHDILPDFVFRSVRM
jgi:hypothetical protein